MNYLNLFRYWRTVLVVAEMSIRMQFSDGFVLFAIVFQPMIIAILALFMLKDKGPDFAMFVVVGSGLTGLWSSLLFVSGNSINVERWIGSIRSDRNVAAHRSRTGRRKLNCKVRALTGSES